jgi:hypothetical protein
VFNGSYRQLSLLATGAGSAAEPGGGLLSRVLSIL